jgi:hypothetical protein
VRVDYRVVGELAALLDAEAADPAAGRLTPDIDIAIRREDVPRIADAAEQFGFEATATELRDLT